MAHEDMQRIFALLVPLNPDTTILAVPCIFEEDNDEECHPDIFYSDHVAKEAEIRGIPVIHLVLNILAKSFPTTNLPVHIHLDLGSTLDSKTTLPILRPSVLGETLAIGDSICTTPQRHQLCTGTFGCYVFTESKHQTLGLTCGHLIEYLVDRNLEPLFQNISSPPLDVIHEERAAMMRRYLKPVDELIKVHSHLEMEGETIHVKQIACRVAQDLIKLADYDLICKEPILLQVGGFHPFR
jgi:hypothetical protein